MVPSWSISLVERVEGRTKREKTKEERKEKRTEKIETRTEKKDERCPQG